MSITVDCNDKKRNARRNVSLLYYLPRRPLHSKCRCNASVMKVLSSDIRSLCEACQNASVTELEREYSH
jgi:hypothetical protein